MSPYEKAARVYETEPCRRTFAEDLHLHYLYGFVFSTPEFFCMGRPVMRDAKESDIVDPGVIFDEDKADCWHIYLYAGDISKAISIMPWPLEWISLERKNELKIYPLAEAVRLAAHIKL
jgi:hypothetical protein